MNNNINKFQFILLISLIIASCGKAQEDDNDHDDEKDGAGVPETSTGTNTNTDINATHRLLAFNDLGMHCADLDYSTFVILPPFNVVHSQVIERGNTPRLLNDSQVNVSYRAVADGSGSINSTSQNQAGAIHKSNFWELNPDTGNAYVFDLFGLKPPADEGLALQQTLGQAMPGILNPYAVNDPQPFKHYDANKKWFAADGVPILPIDDSGQQNATR